jgi:hypothetical protein
LYLGAGGSEELYGLAGCKLPIKKGEGFRKGFDNFSANIDN